MTRPSGGRRQRDEPQSTSARRRRADRPRASARAAAVVDALLALQEEGDLDADRPAGRRARRRRAAHRLRPLLRHGDALGWRPASASWRRSSAGRRHPAERPAAAPSARRASPPRGRGCSSGCCRSCGRPALREPMSPALLRNCALYIQVGDDEVARRLRPGARRLTPTTGSRAAGRALPRARRPGLGRCCAHDRGLTVAEARQVLRHACTPCSPPPPHPEAPRDPARPSAPPPSAVAPSRRWSGSATTAACSSRAPGTPPASWPGGPAGRPRASPGSACGPGDRVVLCMANCPEVGIAYAALWRAGAVPTPVLFLLTEDELRHVVADSGADRGRDDAGVPAEGAGRRAGGLPVVVVVRRGRATARSPGRSSRPATSCRWSTATPTTSPRCSTPAARPGAARASR